MIKIPKNDSKYYWTQHVIRKMAYYGISSDRVRKIVRNPKRTEEGVAENTIAVMQPGTNKKKPSEIWVMYQQKNYNRQSIINGKKGSKSLANNNFYGRKIIISAWRYPGVSPVGKQIPIPVDILEELRNDGLILQDDNFNRH